MLHLDLVLNFTLTLPHHCVTASLYDLSVFKDTISSHYYYSFPSFCQVFSGAALKEPRIKDSICGKVSAIMFQDLSASDVTEQAGDMSIIASQCHY